MTRLAHITRRCRALCASALAMTLIACATPSGSGPNLAQTIANNPELSTFNQLVQKAGMTEALSGSRTYTVFAPNNAAFKDIPVQTLEDLSNNPKQLNALLEFHIMRNPLPLAALDNGKYPTLHASSVTLYKAGDLLTIENAVVSQADISAANGVVHVIDSVMMPPPPKK